MDDTRYDKLLYGPIKNIASSLLDIQIGNVKKKLYVMSRIIIIINKNKGRLY